VAVATEAHKRSNVQRQRLCGSAQAVRPLDGYGYGLVEPGMLTGFSLRHAVVRYTSTGVLIWTTLYKPTRPLLDMSRSKQGAAEFESVTRKFER
jgi:hypothetical protein